MQRAALVTSHRQPSRPSAVALPRITGIPVARPNRYCSQPDSTRHLFAQSQSCEQSSTSPRASISSAITRHLKCIKLDNNPNATASKRRNGSRRRSRIPHPDSQGKTMPQSRDALS